MGRSSVLLVDLEAHPDIILADSDLGLAPQVKVVALGYRVESVLELGAKRSEVAVVDLESAPIPVDVGLRVRRRTFGPPRHDRAHRSQRSDVAA